MHGSGLGIAHQSSSAARALRAGLVAALVLAGCGPPPRPTPPAPPLPPACPALGAVAGPLYRVDPQRSELRILVYRAGPLARLGHNHVLLSRDLAGEVRLRAPGALAGAAFALSLPVAGLAIDEPAARREEGAEFATEPSAADIDGTRQNLLGTQMLDAAAYPRLLVCGTTEGPAAGIAARASIEVRGRASVVSVPLAVATEADTLTIRGGFGVSQTTLGLTPFSIGLGALTVRDELEVRFRIVAVGAH